MMTWTCNDFAGHWPVGTAAVVTAESVETAGVCVDSALVMKGLEERIADLEELFSHE